MSPQSRDTRINATMNIGGATTTEWGGEQQRRVAEPSGWVASTLRRGRTATLSLARRQSTAPDRPCKQPSQSHQVSLCSLYNACIRVCVCVQEQLSAVIAEKGSFTPKLGSRPSTPLSSARPSIDGSFTMPGRSLADEFAAYVSVCCCHARAFVTFCHVCTFRMMTWWNNWNKKLLRSNNSWTTRQINGRQADQCVFVCCSLLCFL